MPDTKQVENETARALPGMPLHAIARIIRADWTKPYFGAVPYIDAMACLDSIEDSYGLDDGEMVVVYFLSNANTWRGPIARAVKAELKKRAGIR